MPSAGDNVRAADFTPRAVTTAGADETGFTSTIYTTGATTVGVVFAAPTSGAVKIDWGARMRSNTAAVFALCSVTVRAGGTLDVGTLVSDSSDSSAIESPAQDRIQASRHRTVSGLTPGSLYNVVMRHKLSAAGTGDIFDRDLVVIPIP